ncbi:MAG: DNA translocase FtsK [Candidatus Limivicinus sp.]|jgi:S-DNA-T family DNA segregation ATPase FtsK/SpoIIIE
MAQSNKKSTKKTSTAAKKSTGRKKAEPAVPPSPPAPPIRREVTAVVFLFLAVFLIISHYNSDGSFIVFFSKLVKGLVGWGFWVTVPAFIVVSFILGFHRGRPVIFRSLCALMVPLLVASIGHLFFADPMPQDMELQLMCGELFEQGQMMKNGGVLGGLLAESLSNAFSLYGALPILIVLLAFALFKAFNGNIFKAVKKMRERSAVDYDPSMYGNKPPVFDDNEFREEQELNRKTVKKRSGGAAKIEKIQRRSFSAADIPLDSDDEELPLRDSRREITAPYSVDKPDEFKSKGRRKKAAPIIVEKMDNTASSAEEAARLAGVDVDELRNTVEEVMRSETMSAEISDPPVKKVSRAEVHAEAENVAAEISAGENKSDYEFPPFDLLRSGSAPSVDSRDEIMLNRDRLDSAIHSFGINASIVDVTRGPTVTRYDIELEQGVKLSRVTNLAGDLALALGVINVRIAPIPNKISTVGIEVPNKIVSTVYLRDIIESQKFQNAKSKLSFALGKDIGGECVVGNIAKLPHMLIAGTTGSGKSVCMNSLIISLLYKAKPEEVRLIMIDPKMVELGVYNGIPHLYVPVVTDPKKAAGALQWSVVEMLKRYRLFSEAGVRDLTSYNKHCKEAGEQILPRVVIVIDELADMMMIASKDVEESICRVAQMGRAAGMHLIIATQRPSADVITGLMKANIPSRIAFAVSSALESRIILDQAGAEKLVGMGDMLFSPVGSGKPIRIQGAFVSDEERENVIQFIKEGTSTVTQNSEIEEFMNKASEDKNGTDSSGKSSKDDSLASEYDEMLSQAVEVVLEMKSCSVSMLQRRVKLGYSRAARIVDQMEELGIVGPYEGAKPRKVLIDRDGWNQIQVEIGLASADEFALPAEMNEESSHFDDLDEDE